MHCLMHSEAKAGNWFWNYLEKLKQAAWKEMRWKSYFVENGTVLFIEAKFFFVENIFGSFTSVCFQLSWA